MVIENRNILFPADNLMYDSELELVGTLYFNELPLTIHSGSIETYANWLGQLQVEDPQKRERAGRVYNPHFPFKSDKHRQTRVRFIDDPWVGTHSVVYTRDYSQESFSIRTPVVDVHSHNIAQPMGVYDLKHFLENLTILKSIDRRSSVNAYMVTTPVKNFLLITTDQTFGNPSVWFDTQQVDILIQYAGYGIDNYRKAEYAGVGYDHRINIEYVHRMFVIQEIANRYTLGFYVSQKDGHYSLVKDEACLDLYGNRVGLQSFADSEDNLIKELLSIRQKYRDGRLHYQYTEEEYKELERMFR